MQAVQILGWQSGAMQLCYMQTPGAIAGDKSSTIVLPVPIELFGGKHAGAAPRNEKAAGEDEER